MRSCTEYQELISRLLDGELTEEEQRDIRRHIDSCPDCAAMYDAFLSLSRTIGEDLEEPPERLHESVMADVRREALRRRQAPKRVRDVLALAACAALVLLAAARLPRMGSNSSSLLAAPRAAEEAAVVEESDTFAEEPAEAPSAALYAAAAAGDSAPAEEAAADRGTQRAKSAGAAVPAEATYAPAPIPEPETAFFDEEEAVPEAAEPASPRPAVWPFLLLGLPLIGALVLLLTRKK